MMIILLLQNFVFICSFLGPVIGKADSLQSYNVEQHNVSISGISSGAAMATQMHVIHSASFMGVGLIAGVPFACSGGTIAGSLACMSTPSLESVSSMIVLTNSGALFGNVDGTSHMKNDRVYIFAGKSDSVVRPGNGPKIQSFYSHYTSQANIKTVLDQNAEHCMPTDNYGGACNVLSTTNFINNCGYNAAYELLNWIYGGLRRPDSNLQLRGELKSFDQSEFFYFASASTYGFDTYGYVYVPSGCTDKRTKCKLHIALHGCKQGRHDLNDEYVKHAGYNEVGEANNIIILYPQAVPNALTNPNGCWDWWGFTGSYFATRSGYQITALDRMRGRVLGH